LDSREYERVGESRTRKADVRIIAATNADLDAKVNQGTFRPDLYYRLNIMTVHMPLLKEREGDIPLLVDIFVRHYARLFGKKIEGVEDGAMGILLDYP